jgi:non-heme chloroperoxidase
MESHPVLAPDGVRLNVVETGQPAGPPILFLHGWSQSLLCWSKQLNSSLADDYRLVAMDLRGHGDSDKPASGYADAKTWADDVQAVIDALGLVSPVLVGWSYAGLVINDYLRVKGQENFAGLCYVGAATDIGIETRYDFLGSSWNGLLPAASGSAAGTVFSADGEEIARAMRAFIRGCFARPLAAEDEMLMLGFNLQCPSRVRAALFARSVANDDVLAGIGVPALVVHGTADEVVRVGTGRHIAATVPAAEISIFDGTGHAPFWEEPQRFNRELDAFLRRVKGAGKRAFAPAAPR